MGQLRTKKLMTNQTRKARPLHRNASPITIPCPFTTRHNNTDGMMHKARFFPYMTTIPAGQATICGTIRCWQTQESLAVPPEIDVFIPFTTHYTGPTVVEISHKCKAHVQLLPLAGAKSYFQVQIQTLPHALYNFWPPSLPCQEVHASYLCRAQSKDAVRTELLGAARSHLASPARALTEDEKLRFRRSRVRSKHPRLQLRAKVMINEATKADRLQFEDPKLETSKGVQDRKSEITNPNAQH